VAGLSAAVVLAWGLATPALWFDESATVIATQRDWGSLLHLSGGSEAPLVPFYALVKLLTGLPGGGFLSPEVLYRLPSVVAAAVAVAVLAAWVSRTAGGLVALAATGAFLLVPSLSRYGQEARPYAVALLCGVLCTVAWQRLVSLPAGSSADSPAGSPADSPAGSPAGSRRTVAWAGAWYAAAVAALTLTNLLAASLVAAHVVLAVADPGEPGRRRALVRTSAAAGAGLLPALPLAATTWAFGRGPTGSPRQATPDQLGALVLELFTERQPEVAGAVVLMALAGLGALRVRSPRYGRVARVALAWATVPLVLLLPAMVAWPSLMTHRYLLFVAPGWAVLAGLGIATLASVAPRWSPVVVVAVLAGVAVLQAAPLAAIRDTDGHGEDIRPALAFARADGRGSLPLVIPGRSAVELAAYGRADEARLLGGAAQREKRSIWPVWDEAGLAAAPPRLVLLLRGTQDRRCRWRPSSRGSVTYVTACMPASLRAQGFVVTQAQPAGLKWTAAVLERR
jgi:mannosyltransferase